MVGSFKDDDIYGPAKGKVTYANGDTYVGEWLDSKRHGQGTYTFANGDTYVGEWLDGIQHGQGVLTKSAVITEGFYYKGKYVPAMCENNGFTKGTESFGQCILNYIDKIDNED